MPPKRTMTGLAAKLGAQLQQAHEAHKSDPITTSSFSGDCPPGVDDGVAHLTMCKIDQYKPGTPMAGEYYLLVRGTVVSPVKTPDGKKAEGTNISFGPEPICDTPDRKSRQTIEQHWAYCLNLLKLLGVNTEEMDWSNAEATCQQLQEIQPYIRFRSWLGRATPAYPNPRTNYDLVKIGENAVCEWDGEVTEDVADNTATDETGSGTDTNEATSDDAGSDELSQLAESAEGGDADAQNELTNRAKECGMEDEAAKANDWAGVADLIRTAEADGDSGKASAAPAVPSVKEVCKYKANGKLVDVTVEKVHKPKKTCDLLNLTNRKTRYENVPWSALVYE